MEPLEILALVPPLEQVAQVEQQQLHQQLAQTALQPLQVQVELALFLALLAQTEPPLLQALVDW
jgi:hypothetical protein